MPSALQAALDNAAAEEAVILRKYTQLRTRLMNAAAANATAAAAAAASERTRAQVGEGDCRQILETCRSSPGAKVSQEASEGRAGDAQVVL